MTNTINFTQTVTTIHTNNGIPTSEKTTVRTVEALPVNEVTTDEIIAFLAGSGYRFQEGDVHEFRNYNIIGWMGGNGFYSNIRANALIVKVNGEVTGPVDAAVFAERYSN